MDTSGIQGDWDILLGEQGRGGHLVRIAIRDDGGRLTAVDADPDAGGVPARVEFDGRRLRFELLSPGSSRGNAHYVFELDLIEADSLAGTRRRGMLARTPIVGQRAVAAARHAMGAEPPAADSPDPLHAADPAVAAAHARAAAAAERARLAAAEAAAAAAEAEAIEAIEAARAAAARVAAARAAVRQLEPAAPPAASRTPIPTEVLGILPAPAAQTAVPGAAPGLPASIETDAGETDAPETDAGEAVAS